MNPKPIPFEMLNVNGITMITSAAWSPMATSWKSILARRRPPPRGSASSSASASELIISQPTITSAGPVACGGTIPISGARNMNGKKRAPQTTDVQPVRPPTAGRERLVVLRPVDERRDQRRRDDPDEQVAAKAARPQHRRDREAEERHEHRPRPHVRERHRLDRVLLHHARVEQADEGDEETDPDRDRLLQLERDRAHDRLTQAGEDEQRDDA